jgi:hypothetical protein
LTNFNRLRRLLQDAPAERSQHAAQRSRSRSLEERSVQVWRPAQ